MSIGRFFHAVKQTAEAADGFDKGGVGLAEGALGDMQVAENGSNIVVDGHRSHCSAVIPIYGNALMLVGLQAGFGSPMASDFHGIAAHGFAVVRQDLFAETIDIRPLIAECVGAPCRPLFLIGGGQIEDEGTGERLEPYELAARTTEAVQIAADVGLSQYALEIGNEPDLAVPGYSQCPEDFAEAVRCCHFAARAAGFLGPVISGGISNLNTRGLKYLKRMIECDNLPPDDLVIGFHRYPEAGRGPLAAHDWFTSRDDEWQTLTALTETSALACTEFGYHTADILNDTEVAASVIWDLNFYAERGVMLAVVYQLNDGPGSTWMDRYGVRRLDGSWKPVAEAVREWTAATRQG